MKKIVVLSSMLVLCLVLCACGSKPAVETAPPAETTASETAGGIGKQEAETEPAVSVAEEAEPEETNSEQTIRPEFKEAMDSYEAFFDEYVLFMEKYAQNPGDLSLLNTYANYMLKYAEMMNKINGVDENDLTAAELAYYIEVTARIEQKLLAVVY